MANIFMLPVDVFLYILSYLDIYDRLAFALTCRMFRQICVEERVFRKMDLSRNPVSTTLRREINTFFRDRQLAQHVTELSFSNLRVLNWKIDDNLIKEFMIPNCHHLEALHVRNCGLSFQRLVSILEQAPKLTALSWSLLDFTSEDIEFVVKDIESSEGMCFTNIKHLRLEMNDSKSHFQVVEYLLLSCFRCLEELEIYIWDINEAYFTGRRFPFSPNRMIPGFSEPSVENELEHLHSLTVATEREKVSFYEGDLFDFVALVLSMKSSSTKWKKLWISPSVSRVVWSNVLHSVGQDDFQSVVAIIADPDCSFKTADELKTFFKGISDNAVRSLYLRLSYEINSTAEFFECISRVGGHSLKFLSLSVQPLPTVPAAQNDIFQTLFSNCMNITELDLFDCHFEKDICESLSKLKHLTKVQLTQCAISSKYENEVEISKANLLTFVKSCKNITYLDVWGCVHWQFSCCLTKDDLLALAKLRNLKCLTLLISGIIEWTFLQSISKHCKFLTTLRISTGEHFNNSHIPILMESAKFLQHLAISVDVPVWRSNVFWNLLSLAKNLKRLCINTDSFNSKDKGWLNVPVALETLKSLPRLHVLHLHSPNIGNVEDFYNKMRRMLEEKESDCRFSFEIVIGDRWNAWISNETGYTLISNKALPLNEAELCLMRPILDIPRF